MNVEYLSDSSVDDAGDRELRGLLSTCFTKPGDDVFSKRRYWREPYQHRWIIRNERGALIAHVGVHDKRVEAEGRTFRIGGICEVCVHPDYRGRGQVKAMLECVHSWLSANRFPFSVLFGDPQVYGSSGYVTVDNVYLNEDGQEGEKVKGMVRQMADIRWPDGDVHLVGLKF